MYWNAKVTWFEKCGYLFWNRVDMFTFCDWSIWLFICRYFKRLCWHGNIEICSIIQSNWLHRLNSRQSPRLSMKYVHLEITDHSTERIQIEQRTFQIIFQYRRIILVVLFSLTSLSHSTPSYWNRIVFQSKILNASIKQTLSFSSRSIDYIRFILNSRNIDSV